MGLLERVRHGGQGPVQRLAEVQGAGPVQALPHHPVRDPAQLQGLRQRAGDEGRSRRQTLILKQMKRFSSLLLPCVLVLTESGTLWPLTDEAVALHLTGPGGPHARFLLWVPVNRHHAVPLRRQVRSSTQQRARAGRKTQLVGGC